MVSTGDLQRHHVLWNVEGPRAHRARLRNRERRDGALPIRALRRAAAVFETATGAS
jgi:hypothetical protein